MPINDKTILHYVIMCTTTVLGYNIPLADMNSWLALNILWLILKSCAVQIKQCFLDSVFVIFCEQFNKCSDSSTSCPQIHWGESTTCRKKRKGEHSACFTAFQVVHA